MQRGPLATRWATRDRHLPRLLAARGRRGGVAPRVPFGPPCGPSPSFVILREGATRWTLAHEFMHVIGWAYPSCHRDPTWVEGVATWAEEFVYHGDQDEHAYPKGILFSYSSLLGEDAGNYQSWPFWYSVAKQGGPEAIKQFILALAGDDREARLGRCRAACARLEALRGEGWNDGRSAARVQVQEAFKQWDSFAQTPATDRREPGLLGGQTEHTFDVNTYGPGESATPAKTWRPSRPRTRGRRSGRDVRELRFQNALSGIPGAAVQAFLKLKNGKGRLEDWSDQSEVTLVATRRTRT